MFTGWEQLDFVLLGLLVLGVLVAVAAILFIVKTLVPHSRDDRRLAELERLIDELSE